MEEKDRPKVDLSQMNAKVRPSRTRADEGEALQTPGYLRHAHAAVRDRDDRRVHCVMEPVMLSANTAAELFVAFLYRTAVRMDRITDAKTGISLFNNQDVRDNFVRAFADARNALDVLYGRGEPETGVAAVGRLASAFGLRESVDTLFRVMEEHFRIGRDEFVIWMPKSAELSGAEYRRTVKSGWTGQWDPHVLSGGILATYFPSVKVQTYAIAPKKAGDPDVPGDEAGESGAEQKKAPDSLPDSGENA